MTERRIVTFVIGYRELEFELLGYLLRHQGQVVSRESLARDVWKETSRSTPLDNVIDVHVARLRRKVDVDVEIAVDQDVPHRHHLPPRHLGMRLTQLLGQAARRADFGGSGERRPLK